MSEKIVAVADASGDFVGSIVWWRLSGGLDIEALRQCWADAYLDPKLLPEHISPQRAFSRACKVQAGPRRLVRPLAASGQGERGWAVVDETTHARGLRHHVSVQLHLNIIGRIVAENDDGERVDNELTEKVRADFQWHLDNMTGVDVSGWLCKMMTQLEAVSLRDTGGVYFVPATSMALWERMVDAIRKASKHALLGVPAIRSEQAVEAALDAVQTECAAAAEALERELEKHNGAETRKDGLLGARALESRVKAAEAAEAKLSRYEDLLGAKLPDLHAKIESVRANLVFAEMAAAQ